MLFDHATESEGGTAADEAIHPGLPRGHAGQTAAATLLSAPLCGVL